MTTPFNRKFTSPANKDTESYFKLLNHSVYIPKFHRQFHDKTKSKSTESQDQSKRVLRRSQHHLYKKEIELNPNKITTFDNHVIMPDEALPWKVEKGPLSEMVQDVQKRFIARNAAKSKSPHLLSNYIPRDIYSSYRKKLSEDIKNCQMSPESVTDDLLSINHKRGRNISLHQESLKKYAFPEFDNMVHALRTTAVTPTIGRSASPKLEIMSRFTQTPSTSSFQTPSIQSGNRSQDSSPRLIRLRQIKRAPMASLFSRQRQQPDELKSRSFKVSQTLNQSPRGRSSSGSQRRERSGSLTYSRRLMTMTPDLQATTRMDTMMDEEFYERKSTFWHDSSSTSQSMTPTRLGQKKPNFYDLSELNFKNDEQGSNQQELLNKMNLRSLSLSQKQALSKEYEKAIKKDNFKDIQRFQKKYRDLVGSLISTQNLQRGLSKTPGFLNCSLALGEECPQNKKIFKEIIKESYHSKIQQKKLVELNKMRQNIDEPVVWKIESLLELPRLNPKSAHLFFSNLFKQHLDALQIRKNANQRKQGYQEISPEYFGFPISLAKLRILKSSHIVREIVMHPVFIKFLKTYSILVNDVDSLRMLLIQALTIISNELERVEAQYESELLMRSLTHTEESQEISIRRPDDYQKRFSVSGCPLFTPTKNIKSSDRSTKGEQWKQNQLSELVKIIKKCNQADNNPPPLFIDSFCKDTIEIPKRNPDDIVIPRLSSRDKRSLFILALSFVYERLIIKGGWEVQNHRKMTQEDFVWVNIDEEKQKTPLKKKKFRIMKHEKKEKTIREKMKEGPQAITIHKTDFPSVPKILYPELVKDLQGLSNKH